MGLLVSKTPDVTIPKATGLILGLTLWRFVVIATHTYRQLMTMLILYLLVGCGMMAGGLFVVQWYVKIPFFQNLTALFPPFLLRLPGSPTLGVSPNQLAGTILLFIPLTIVIVFRLWPKKRMNILLICALISGILATFLLLLTQSRSGWIGAVACIGSMIGLYIISLPIFKSRHFTSSRLLLFLIIIVLATGVWAVLSPDISGTMNTKIDELPRSTSYNIAFRQEIWQVGVQAAGENPLTGVGLGSFRRIFANDYVTSISPDIDIAHAHNIFLQVALDIGIPGLVAYLTILLVAFYVGWETIREDERMKPLAISLLSGLVGFHIYSLTDTISFGSKSHFVFWLVIALLAGMRQMSKLGFEDGRQ